MTRLTAFLFTSTLTAYTAAAASSMCYFPDGTPSPTDFVCNSTTADGFQSCCGHQQDGSQAYCMSNGLCLSDMFLSRGSCTDKTFKSGSCAQVCTTTNPSGGVGVRPCGYTGKWDCGDGSGCGQNPIVIPTGDFILTNAQLAAMNISRTSGSSSNNQNSQPSPSSGLLTASSTTATVTIIPTAVSSPEVSPGVVGAAVGVPLAVIACSFLALWLLERRKTKQARAQLQQAGAYPAYQFPPGAPQSQQGLVSQSRDVSFAAGGMKRNASQYSVVSPTSQHQRGASAFDMAGAASAQHQHHPSIQQSIQRMPSRASQLGVHPAYQQDHQSSGYEYSGAPPPPPKAYGGNAWAAEVPADEPRGHRRGMSQVQELPTEH